jgi:hypothetical protein
VAKPELRSFVLVSIAFSSLLTACDGGEATAPVAIEAGADCGDDSAPDGAPSGEPCGVALLEGLGLPAAEQAELREGRLQLPPSTTVDPCAGQPTSLSCYEVALPHTTRPSLPAFERALLVAYLDHPREVQLANALAVHHLPRSLLAASAPSDGGRALRHTIFSLYFLNRAKDLGATAPWIDTALGRTETALATTLEDGAPITLDESHDAHVFWRRVFHGNQEGDRYDGLARLLQDVAGDPRNVYTSFLLMTANLWMGSEADYDDPTTLYHFLLSTYFQIRAFDLARGLEVAWTADPERNPRFRMAAELGGFGLLARRWLAKLHGDAEALRLVDEEHREWWRIQPAIHSFSLGLPFFDEPERFAEGLEVYYSAYPYCEAVPVRTCSNLARFPFNLLSFALGLVDFSLRAGDLERARAILGYRLDPGEAANWSEWNVGRDAWLHRERNLDAIFALYRNGDPSDDPVNFETKRRRWGEETTVCQVCHQTQGKPQTQAEIEAPQTFPPPEVASVGRWPAVDTAWYGASLRR